MAGSAKVPSWTTVATALVGIAGGAASGGLAAYTQLSTSQEQFSIDRANMFKGLIEDLQNESTARMALLNLWQLYPEERDQKIIVAAAIEIGHPDLVETIVGFDEELRQVSDILHAKALSGDPNVARPALQTLERIDPVRAARIMLNSIQEEVQLNGDRYIDNDITAGLIRLARTDGKVADVIRSAGAQSSKMPVIFDYLLYAAGRDSTFTERMAAAYGARKDLWLFSGFLTKGDYKGDDADSIVRSVRGFIAAAIEQHEPDYDLVEALVGLKNNSFRDQLDAKSEENERFADLLGAAVADAGRPDIVRAKALALLRKVSKHAAFLALAGVLRDRSGGSDLLEEIEQQLAGGLAAALEKEEPGFSGPVHCVGAELRPCIDQAEGWRAWLTRTAHR